MLLLLEDEPSLSLIRSLPFFGPIFSAQRKRDGRKGRKKGRKERREGGLRKEGKREDVREKEKEHKVRMYGEEEGRSEFRNKKISVDNYNAMGISRAKGA